MTFEEFDKFQAELWEECIKMKLTKGKEYANSTSRFANFNRLAESLGLTNIQVGWVYTAKHIDAIAQFCRTQQTHSSENIRGRIVDAMVYLSLIAGMIKEHEQDTLKIEEIKVKHTIHDATYQCAWCKSTFKFLHELNYRVCSSNVSPAQNPLP
jgi:hypothetical protein